MIKPAYELRPLGMGELLDYTFKLYKSAFPYIALPFAILQGPFMLPLFFINSLASTMQRSLISAGPGAGDPGIGGMIEMVLQSTGMDLSFLLGWGMMEWIMLGSGFALLLFVMGILAVVMQIGIVSVVGQRILGNMPTWEMVFDAYRRFGVRALIAGILKGLLIFGALLLMVLVGGGIMAASIAASGSSGSALSILGGVFGGFLIFVGYLFLIWLSYALIFVEPSLVVEDLQPVAAVRRSLALIRGHWWRALLNAFVLGLLIQIVASILTGVASFIVALAFMNNPAYLIWSTTLISTTTYIFTQPLALILQVLLYFDVRVRKEQFDLYYLLGNTGGVQYQPAPTFASAGPAPAPAYQPPPQQLPNPYAPPTYEAPPPPTNPYDTGSQN